MEALVEVAEVASVVAEVAIAETATEAIVAAAGAAIAETAMEAIGVAEAEAIAVAAEVGMEAMEVAMAVGTREAMVEAMTRDPIKKDSYGYDRRELKITAILVLILQKCCKIQFI